MPAASHLLATGWCSCALPCAAASSRASAMEASREATLSARLVRITGTFAPSTMPALSAPAR